MFRQNPVFSAAATAFAAIAPFFAICALVATQASATLAPLSAENAAANEAFIRTTEQLRSSAVPFKIGSSIPSFALYDQDERPVLLPEAYKGKFILISFIFTRCQVATMCPAATAKMVAVQRSLEQLGLSDRVQLVSISFDPRHDTPEVMHQYAQIFGAKTDNYAFLTGEPKLIDTLLKRFSILTRDSGGTIVHTMTTSLIDPEGALALQERGESWLAETFLKYIQDRIEAEPSEEQQ